MKKIFILLFFIGSCKGLFATSNKCLQKSLTEITSADSTTYLIMLLDFESFRDKPIDSLLVKLPQNYSSIKMYGAGVKGPLNLIIHYPNGNSVFVYVQRPICCVSNPLARPSQWSLNEFKMEKANDITLYDGINCLKGCHPYKEYN